MTGQLDQISEAIGQLRASVQHLHQCVHSVGERMDDRCDKIEGKVSQVQGKVDKLSDDLTLDKTDLAKLKAKGTGVLIGVSLVSGFVGSKLSALGHLVKAIGN